MSVLSRVRRFISPGDEPAVVVECRQCGTTLEASRDRCPECGSDDVVATVID
ncbi:hypothetical protein [Halomicrococcus sp. NG-SE-24]|uniref:hypothetical protein n=1 Tax=unclassified Halomicrococcus TaxID=2614448 RepID=UPI003D9882F2